MRRITPWRPHLMPCSPCYCCSGYLFHLLERRELALLALLYHHNLREQTPTFTQVPTARKGDPDRARAPDNGIEDQFSEKVCLRPCLKELNLYVDQSGIESYEAPNKGPVQKRRKIERWATKRKDQGKPSHVSCLLSNFLRLICLHNKKLSNWIEEEENGEEEEATKQGQDGMPAWKGSRNGGNRIKKRCWLQNQLPKACPSPKP